VPQAAIEGELLAAKSVAAHAEGLVGSKKRSDAA
jgi:hypothetical protein